MKEKEIIPINLTPEQETEILRTTLEKEKEIQVENLNLEQEINIENLNLENELKVENSNLETEIKPELEFNIKKAASNYNELDNKPKINNVELVGNKTSEDLGIHEYDDTEIKEDIENLENNKANRDEIITKTSELENDSGYITSFVNVPSTKLSVYANSDAETKYLRVNFMGSNEDFLKLCGEGKVKLYLYKYTRSGKKSWTDSHDNTRENTSVKKWVHPANRYYDRGERPDLQCWGVMSLARTVNDGVEGIEEIISNAEYYVGKNDCGYVVSEYQMNRAQLLSGYIDIPLNDIMSPIVRVSNHGNGNLLLPTSGDDYTVHIMGARNKPGRAREIQPIRYCLVVDMEDSKHTKYVGDCLNTAQLELFTYRATWDNHSTHGYLTKYSFLDDIGYSVRII